MHWKNVACCVAVLSAAFGLVGCGTNSASRPTIAPSYMFHQDDAAAELSSLWPVDPNAVVTHVDEAAMPDLGVAENALH